MKKLIYFFVMLGGPCAFAAYPPFAASALYINTILSDKQVVDALGILNSIDSITRRGESFIVTAGGCSLEVKIKAKEHSGPIPPSPVGEFDLEILEKICN